MYLIDTSVWIESFKKGSKIKIDSYFQSSEIKICLPVYQEILQGIRDDNSYLAIKRSLEYSSFLENPIPKSIYDESISIYRQGRKKGFTIRSSIDCLISAIAIKNNVTVIHLDRDFEVISQFTDLKETNILDL